MLPNIWNLHSLCDRNLNNNKSLWFKQQIVYLRNFNTCLLHKAKVRFCLEGRTRAVAIFLESSIKDCGQKHEACWVRSRLCEDMRRKGKCGRIWTHRGKSQHCSRRWFALAKECSWLLHWKKFCLFLLCATEYMPFDVFWQIFSETPLNWFF